MHERERAEEDLRVIRTLMERATIYRAISAPTALAGGVLAVTLTAIIWVREHHWAENAPEVIAIFLLVALLHSGWVHSLL
jgi:hypothetical protein